MLVGDFNLHFACLGHANSRYQRCLDKEVLEMLLDPVDFGCTLRNPVGVRTHKSGTIIDVVALTRGVGAKVNIIDGEGAGLESDHARVDVVLSGRVALEVPKIGRSKWRQGEHGDWDDALSKIPCGSTLWSTSTISSSSSSTSTNISTSIKVKLRELAYILKVYILNVICVLIITW